MNTTLPVALLSPDAADLDTAAIPGRPAAPALDLAGILRAAGSVSPREAEIVGLAAIGLSRPSIARRCDCTVAQVHTVLARHDPDGQLRAAARCGMLWASSCVLALSLEGVGSLSPEEIAEMSPADRLDFADKSLALAMKYRAAAGPDPRADSTAGALATLRGRHRSQPALPPAPQPSPSVSDAAPVAGEPDPDPAG